jgi:hypothetical protein
MTATTRPDASETGSVWGGGGFLAQSGSLESPPYFSTACIEFVVSYKHNRSLKVAVQGMDIMAHLYT